MKKVWLFIVQFFFLMIINISTSYAAIRIVPDEIFIGVDYSQNLGIINANSSNITWISSNPSIVSVDNGRITGSDTGVAYVKATSGENIAICKVNVIDNYVPVTSISINKYEETLLLGDIIKIDTTVLPISASNKTPFFASSASDIVSVSSLGYVTAKKLGSANISVTVEDKMAILKVNVVDKIALKKIAIPESISLKQGQSSKISLTYTPQNATNKKVTWKSSDKNVVTVSADGTIRAVGSGNANVTVTSDDGNYVAVCKVTVTTNSTNQVTTTKKVETTTISGAELKGISLNKSSASLNIGDEEELVVTYTPSNATNKKVIWKSSNEKVVTVSDDGKIKAISAGTSMITVTSDNGKYVSRCYVTVKSEGNDSDNDVIISNEIKLTGISLNKKILQLKQGEETQLEVTFNPIDATNKEVSWVSSNPEVATVNDGKVTAVLPGEVKIKVVSNEGNYEDSCDLYVYSNEAIEEIKFDSESYTMYIADNLTLKTIATPEYTMIDNPVWTSSNPEVATIDNGIVTALKKGMITITVSDENDKISASTIVYVIEKPEPKIEITIDNYELNFDENVNNYTLSIGSESELSIKTNYEESKVQINGNKSLKNGSIITITITKNNDKKVTYVINIRKKGFNVIYFIGIISVLLILNIIRILINSKRRKD